jgi:hypothetical protein
MADPISLEIYDGDRLLFGLTKDIACAPSIESEREVVFRALANALAFMAGLKEQCSTASSSEILAQRVRGNGDDGGDLSSGDALCRQKQPDNEIPQEQDFAPFELPQRWTKSFQARE